MNSVKLVSPNGKKVREVTMLSLRTGTSLVFSGKLNKKEAMNVVFGLVAKNLDTVEEAPVRKYRRRGRAKKLESAE